METLSSVREVLKNMKEDPYSLMVSLKLTQKKLGSGEERVGRAGSSD